MKTHMNNTVAHTLKHDIMAQTHFEKHHQLIYSGQIKPKVVTKRKQQHQVHKNNKVQINTNPNQHVNILFKKLYNSTNQQNKQKINIKSTLNNKKPMTYDFSKTILKDKIKKNKQQQFKQKQHQREFNNLQNRIKNCKSINQRKKNTWDPIVNPVYLMKDNKEDMQKASIEPYCRKVLDKNRPKSAINPSKNIYPTYMQQNQSQMNQIDQPQSVYYGSAVPDYRNQHPKKSSIQNHKKPQRPSTANNKKKTQTFENQNKKPATSDLPQPTFNGLMKYILQNKVYKDTDLKVFYVRLCYLHGQEQIDELWEQVMDELQR